MVELYLLEQLVGIAQYDTLAEASVHLHVTQPTLTRSIQKIEQLFGATLFRREKNRIYMNDTGRLAVEYAGRILALEVEMEQAVRSSDQQNRVITIGACAPAPIFLLEPVLKAQYPQMQIVSSMAKKSELLDGLRRSRLHLIILDEMVSDDALYCQQLGTECLGLSVLPTHPAVGMDSVSFADLDGGSFLVYHNLGVWEEVVRTQMPKARFIMQNGMDEYTEIVNSSSIPTFDTNWAIGVYGKSVNRVSVPIRDDAAKMTFYVVCRKTDRRRFALMLSTLSKII